MSQIHSIGFIGFGAMAQPMATNLRARGIEHVQAFAPSQRSGERAGTPMCGSIKETVDGVQVVVVSLPEDDALANAMYGEDGALAHMTAGQLLINTTSNSPEASLRLYREAKAKGIGAVDAPVSGSTPEAEGAQLVVIAGGDAVDFERARLVLEKIAKAVHHVGGPGAGSKMKLVINGIMGAGMMALTESLSYGLKAGLDKDVLFDVLDGVAVISPHHARKLRSVRAGNFAPQFPLALMSKDMRLLLEGLNRLGVPAPTLAAAAQWIAYAGGQRGDEDYAAVCDAVLGLTRK
jgi:3-hydroxyisobutyrate dehydrogenase-like beta-hydroxyacid dehydrogenase